MPLPSAEPIDAVSTIGAAAVLTAAGAMDGVGVAGGAVGVATEESASGVLTGSNAAGLFSGVLEGATPAELPLPDPPAESVAGRV